MYETYIRQYLRETEEIARTVSQSDISAMIKHLVRVRDRGGRLFIIGVGGSAANASHAVNDFRKMCKMETYAPTDNVSELTAWTNDNGFEWIFSYWLEGAKLRKEDAVLVFSVGGGSETTSRNITLALQYAKQVGATILGIVSRDGGTTRRLADASVLIPVVHDKRITPHAEGWQAIVWHLLANALAGYHPTPPYGEVGKFRSAVFIDRDGVVNAPITRTGFTTPTAPWSIDELNIFEHVPRALDSLRDQGFLRILITNQPDVAYGNLSEEQYDRIHQSILDLSFDDYDVCFHGRDEHCDCKKPKTGMFMRMAEKWNIDFRSSFVVGDTANDIEAGRMVGSRTILIDAPYNKEVTADYRVQDLSEAADLLRALRFLTPNKVNEPHT